MGYVAGWAGPRLKINGYWYLSPRVESAMFYATGIKSNTALTHRSALVALLLVAPIPSLGVWAAAFAAPGALGSVVWLLAKLGLLLGPVLIWRFAQQQPLRWPEVGRAGLLAGITGGTLLGLIIVLAYWLLARDSLDFSELQSFVTRAGIDSPGKYLGLALYLTLVNSLIEEYVFRWFIFVQLRRLMVTGLALLASALVFTVHHSLVLSVYVPWHFNLLASAGVFSAGLIWSYLCQRYGSIWPAYLCHIGADIGVFMIGYDALF